MGWLERKATAQFVRQNPELYGWVTDMVDRTPGFLWKLIGFAPLATHRRHAKARLIDLARLGALQAQDCGACLQLGVDQALKNGVPKDIVVSALEEAETLEPLDRAAYFFGRSIIENGSDLSDIRDLLSRELGDGVVAELALAAATASVFPLTKRGLGIDVSCALYPVRVLETARLS